ncbi:MAG: hypothetical protein ACJ739_06380 [Acidimicrobiales bacterium]
MSLGAAIADLHGAEVGLARDLEAAAERHALDADMLHHARALAGLARVRAGLLVPHAERYGVTVGSTSPGPVAAAADAVRHAAAQVLGHHEPAGAMLLHDLRELHAQAGRVELSWWVVRQGAMVHRDTELADLFTVHHETAWNTLGWLKTKVKEAAPQVLSVGPDAVAS